MISIWKKRKENENKSGRRNFKFKWKYNICVQNGLLRKYINENEKIQIIKIKENGNIIKF